MCARRGASDLGIVIPVDSRQITATVKRGSGRGAFPNEGARSRRKVRPLSLSVVESNVAFSVVMPVFNEGGLIAQTVGALVQALSGERDYEIVLVDDGSRDSTWADISALCAEDPRVRGLRFTRNFGHQAALHAGMQAAVGRAVITMDADGEHPPALVPVLLEKWRSGAKVVQTLRQAPRQLSWLKRRTSGAFYAVFSWLAETRIQAGSADFRLLDREVVTLLAQHPNAAAFLRGFVPWTGFETAYISFEQGIRTMGRSKFTPGKMMALARKGIIGFSVKPLRLSSLLGALTCLIALATLVHTLVIRLAFPAEAEPGWATIASLLALLGGAQLLTMGILGEYIAVMFETLRNQPPFIVAERRGFPTER